MREMLDGATERDMANGVPPKTIVRGVVESSRVIALGKPLESVQEILTAGGVYDLLSNQGIGLASVAELFRENETPGQGRP